MEPGTPERENRRVPRVPPSGPGSFLLGSARALQRDQLGTYARAMAACGDIARFRVGPPGVGFTFDAVFSPEGAREVLAADSSHYLKDAPVIGEFRHFLGDGLLVSEGERWRHHRRVAQPLFTRRATGAHTATIAATTDDLVSWCESDAGADRVVDLHELSMRYALHALGRTVFGDDITQVAPILRPVLPALGDHLKRRSLAPARSPHWWPSTANRRGERIRRLIWDLADTLIAARSTHGAGDGDLLSRLLAARDPDTGEGLSHDDIRDEVIIFLIAGHETTGSALAFTLHLIGRHPAVQERVRTEVRDATALGPLEVAGDDLPYTRQVVNEALRLYPPAHTVVRRTAAPTELLGYPLPEGHIVAVNIWGVHRHPSVWPDPDAFSPDRFEARGSDDDRRAGYRHLPFAGGRRACIGEHLAMAELVLAVAAVVRRFDLESVLDTPGVEVDLSLRPLGALPCRLRPLDTPS